MSDVSLSDSEITCRPLIEQFADYLVACGYADVCARESLSVVAHFNRWLGKREISPATVKQFIHRHLPACRCQPPMIRYRKRVYMALYRLLSMIRPPVPVSRPEFSDDFVGGLLRRYGESLINVRGLVAGTVRNRLRSARTMVTRLRATMPSHFAAWTLRRIEDYVADEAQRHQPSTAHAIATETRCFLRFLLQEGLVQHDFSSAVPRFARWRLASLPKTLSEDELDQLINQPNIDTPIGLRDRAILVCMGELGLRAAEVANLELDGVDLVAGVLRVRRGKRGGSTTLPIPRKFANALKAYLGHGRPKKCTSPTLFVSHWPPVGNPIRPVTISVMVKRSAARAGLRKEIGGAHVLRHSLATRLLGAGANLREIADVLGHQSINSTTIYAKVDLKSLSQVGLPWPEMKGVQQ